MSPDMQTISAFLFTNEYQRFDTTFEIVLIDQLYLFGSHCIYPNMVVV